jgi:magnesium transporter
MTPTNTFSRRSHKTGLSPGTLVHIGQRKTDKVLIWELDYNADSVRNDKEMPDVTACLDVRDKTTTTWINITGIHEPAVIEKACSFFDVHPLIQEDILNTGQRPKLEDFEKYVYIVLKVICWDKEANDLVVDQISILLADTYVVTFQEVERGVLNPVRDRIRTGKGKIRRMGADYLVYAILDAIVDNYFAVLEQVGDQIETLEEEMVNDSSNRVLHEIHRFKRDMINLRKAVWPAREVMGALHRGESALFKEGTLIYLKDVSDHTIQIIDTVESYRDMVSGLLDFYISNMNNKMNEVMKVLTVISTIFIPITFIASIYGMNFEGMPELHMPGGYFAALGLMGFIGISLYIYFKHRRWI